MHTPNLKQKLFNSNKHYITFIMEFIIIHLPGKSDIVQLIMYYNIRPSEQGDSDPFILYRLFTFFKESIHNHI